MRFITSVLLLSATALVVAHGDHGDHDETPVAPEHSDVLSLTSETFEATIKAEPLLLVEFFAPWFVYSCLVHSACS